MPSPPGEQHQVARTAVPLREAYPAQQPSVQPVLHDDAAQRRRVEPVGRRHQPADGFDQQTAGARTAQERKARHLFAARKQGEHDDMQVFALQHGITAAPASAAQPPDRHPAEQPERHGGGRRGIYHEKRFGHKSRFKSLDTLPRSRCRLSGKAIYWSTPHSSRLRTACSD